MIINYCLNIFFIEDEAASTAGINIVYCVVRCRNIIGYWAIFSRIFKLEFLRGIPCPTLLFGWLESKNHFFSVFFFFGFLMCNCVGVLRIIEPVYQIMEYEKIKNFACLVYDGPIDCEYMSLQSDGKAIRKLRYTCYKFF